MGLISVDKEIHHGEDTHILVILAHRNSRTYVTMFGWSGG